MKSLGLVWVLYVPVCVCMLLVYTATGKADRHVSKHVLTILNSSGLRNWDPEDNPWIEHARWSAECPYILKMKGQAFIDLVQEAARAAEMADNDGDNEADNESVSGGFC